MADSPSSSAYPGERLGLPAGGAGSVARPGRRIGALAIDWTAAYIIAAGITLVEAAGRGSLFERLTSVDSFLILSVFAVVQIVFIPTIGGSPGHRLVGLYLAPLSGGWVGLWRPIVRTVLLVLVIPAVIWDPDQRGLHDKAAGTALLRVG